MTLRAIPPDYSHLRALLRLVQKAIDTQDTEALKEYELIARGLNVSSDIHTNLRTYLFGSLEQIGGGQSGYWMYDAESIALSHNTLQRVAFGTFTEAIHDLKLDIQQYSYREERWSDQYNPEYFDSDDRKIWDEARTVLDTYDGTWSDEADDATDDVVRRINVYMQKYYGPLIPIMGAVYRHDQHSASVRLAWVDEALQVTTYAPFAEAIEEYFAQAHPITSVDDFKSEVYPEQIAGYKREDVTSASLFRHEL